MKVFISYSHKDKESAYRIVHDIRRIEKENHRLNFEVWQYEEQIALGEPWVVRIHKAIEDADAILVVVSSNTDESRFQTSEIAFAIASQRKNPSKRVVPVLISQPVRLPFFLQDIQYCDLSSAEKYSTNLQNLVEALSHPQKEKSNLHDLDKQKIEALSADRDLLMREKEILAKKKQAWSETVISIVATSSTVILILIASALLGLTSWLKQSSRFGDYILGAIAGVAAAWAGVIVTSLLRKKAARKEANDAKR